MSEIATEDREKLFELAKDTECDEVDIVTAVNILRKSLILTRMLFAQLVDSGQAEYVEEDKIRLFLETQTD